MISIHAPARGATVGRYLLRPLKIGFQSTLPQGERRRPSRASSSMDSFQSTLPQGERPSPRPRARSNSPDFNPRSRKGSDTKDKDMDTVLPISIHAPARGATPVIVPIQHAAQFQSTLPQGERRAFRLESRLRPQFQSTLPQGERRVWQFHFSGTHRFQSTLPQGERRYRDVEFPDFVVISIHAPARGATP